MHYLFTLCIRTISMVITGKLLPTAYYQFFINQSSLPELIYVRSGPQERNFWGLLQQIFTVT